MLVFYFSVIQRWGKWALDTSAGGSKGMDCSNVQNPLFTTTPALLFLKFQNTEEMLNMLFSSFQFQTFITGSSNSEVGQIGPSSEKFLNCQRHRDITGRYMCAQP